MSKGSVSLYSFAYIMVFKGMVFKKKFKRCFSIHLPVFKGTLKSEYSLFKGKGMKINDLRFAFFFSFNE